MYYSRVVVVALFNVGEFLTQISLDSFSSSTGYLMNLQVENIHKTQQFKEIRGFRKLTSVHTFVYFKGSQRNK